MYPKRCGECGGEVTVSHDPLREETRGETVTIAGVEHGVCSGCGEVFLTVDAMEQVQKQASRQVRESRGLLQPEEIRSLRQEALGLTQGAFERLLGVGQKTVIRWEKGTVFQSATADLLMRLIRDVPAVLPALQGTQAQFQVTVSAPEKTGQGWRAPRNVATCDLEVVKHERVALAA